LSFIVTGLPALHYYGGKARGQPQGVAPTGLRYFPPYRCDQVYVVVDGISIACFFTFLFSYIDVEAF